MLWRAVRIFVCTSAFAVLRLIPLEVIERMSLCVFYHMTGQRCIGCGMTRAFANLLRGDFVRAWEWNPLSFLLFPACALLTLDDLISFILTLSGHPRRSLIDRLLGYKKSAS